MSAQAFEASDSNFFIYRDCNEYLKSKCTHQSQGLKRSLEACAINAKAHQCDKIVEDHPDLKDLVVSCQPKEMCEQILINGTDEAVSCWRGLKDSAVDTATAIKEIAQKVWDKAVVHDHEKMLHEVAQNNFSTYLPKQLQKPKNSEEENRNKVSGLWKTAGDMASAKYHEYSCLTRLAKEEMKCYVFASLVDPTVVVGKGAKLIKARRVLQAMKKESGSAKSVAKAPKVFTRDELNKKYLHYSPTTSEQNLKWMSLAENTKPSNVKYFDVENSVMKELNDTLKDKNLVTSLTNYHKDLLQNKVENLYKDLKKTYPDLELVSYSDFKASRFAFKGQGPPDMDQRLNKILQETNQEFKDAMVKNKIVNSSDNPGEWFRAGYGETADQATLASRFSRQADGNSLQNYASQDMKANLTSKMNKAESLRSGLQNELARTSVMDGKTLSTDALDILRKNGDDIAKSQADLKNRFGLRELPMGTVAKMRLYSKVVDEFSPGIHIAQREVANLDEAVFGGLSADMAGMGAKNLSGTAKALAESRTLDEALEQTRKAEKAVTEQFRRQKQDFQGVLNDVVGKQNVKTVCSGDDCVALPTRALADQEKEQILERLSAAGYSSKFRLSFVSDKVTDASTRTQLSVHGESIEKALRKNLADKMEPNKLKGILFGVDMKTGDLNRGPVKLITVSHSDVKLSAQEEKLIQESFKKALQQVNSDLQDVGKAAAYRAW
ncbi:hypothetical protein [Bdellovibrio sp. HCB337]|uniref:hypothetical protein n=1 Tax=Bdellovibrio sp. HCB337 TaxID=3394358 RepID=UPI0039A5416F